MIEVFELKLTEYTNLAGNKLLGGVRQSDVAQSKLIC